MATSFCGEFSSQASSFYGDFSSRASSFCGEFSGIQLETLKKAATQTYSIFSFLVFSLVTEFS